MKRTLFVIMLVALFLVACSAPKPSSETPSVPYGTQPSDIPSAPADTNAAPAGSQATAPTSAADAALGTVEKETALGVNDVRCDKASRKITFRFKNIDKQMRTWHLDQELGFDAAKDQANVKVFINSYEANNPRGYILNGERMFGPAEKFSGNCEGKTTLAYDEAVTCTLMPVSLKSGNQLTAGKNEILISALPDSKNTIVFLCE